MTVSATLLGTLLKGVAASRPAANAVAGGTIYSATDTGAITQSDGSSWATFATISGGGLTDPLTNRGDIMVRNASNVTARLGLGVNFAALRSDGTDVGYAILPGTTIALKVDTSGDHTVTATSLTDVDATNAAVTFTAPPSGNVLVRCSFLATADKGGGTGGNVGDLMYVGLRESSSDIGGSGFIAHRLAVSGTTVNIYQPVVLNFYLSGVSAGSHTYKLSAKVSDGGRQRGNVGASANNALIMEVIAQA